MLTNSKIITNVLLTTLTLIFKTPEAATVTRWFGKEPYNDVIAAARAAPKCTGLTSNKLVVMMLVPSWYETTGADGGQHATPSPMTLSRHDYGIGKEKFYSSYTFAGEPRAFAHPGIGLWQFDDRDGGLGADLVAHERINTAISSDTTAKKIAYEYCRQSGTDANKRRLAWGAGWGGWFACRDATEKNLKRCEDAFNNHYRPTGDAILNITFDPAVKRLGGMILRDCALSSNRYGFACYYIDPSRAQGHKRTWQEAELPLIGGANGGKPSPLALPFYNYKAIDNHEYRHWLKDDTAYTSEFSVRRPKGADSSKLNVWQKDNVLCQGIKVTTFLFTPLGGTCNFL